MDIHSFGNHNASEGIPPRDSIIVVGDRRDIQLKSIDLKVCLLVITGGLEVDDDIIEKAKEAEVSLIVSPFDSATTSWIIRSATRLNNVLDRKFLTFREDDTLDHVKRKVNENYLPSYIVVDDEDRLVGIFSRTDLIKPAGVQMVMVDHNEIGQAVNGIDQAKSKES